MLVSAFVIPGRSRSERTWNPDTQKDLAGFRVRSCEPSRNDSEEGAV
jgi:hypothetical protein